MNDFINSKQRISRPKKIFSEDLKMVILSLTIFVSFLVVLTQPGGFI